MAFGIGFGVWGLLNLAGFIWIIYELVTNQKNMETLHKVLWGIGAFLFGIITAIIYYFVVKKK